MENRPPGKRKANTDVAPAGNGRFAGGER